MTPKSTDPSRYKLHVVSFSVVREAGPEPRPRPKLNDPSAVADLARQIIADDAKEHFWVLLLDGQNRLVAAHEVSTGTLSASLVHPREVFGPALPVYTFKTLDEALEKANSSEFGLGSSIWTRNLLHANKGIDKLQAGNVWVNSLHYGYDELPFGGVKSSGVGREHGPEALDYYLEPKGVVVVNV